MALNSCGDPPERIGYAQVRSRVGEVNVVEKIICLGPKQDRVLLGDCEAFGKGEICIE